MHTLWFCLQEKETIRLKRDARSKGGFYVPAEAKVLFVVRIKGLNHVAPKVRSWNRTSCALGTYGIELCLSYIALSACRSRKFCSCCACVRSTWACS